MRKWIIGSMILTVTLAVGIGGIFAEGTNAPGPANPAVEGTWTVEDMLPFMKKMHPTVDEKTLKEMVEACHANGGPGMMMGKGMMGPGMMRNLN